MKIDVMNEQKNIALKEGNMKRKQVISDMIAYVKQASYTPKGKVEITDKLVDESLIKYQKMIQEKVDTCPLDKLTTLMEYKDELRIVKEFAPQLLTNPKDIEKEIAAIAKSENIVPSSSSKGLLTKKVMVALKGKADLAVARDVVNEMCK